METYRDICRALADNDMNATKAAKALYIGKRTMWTYIDKIKKQTGLNPRKFWDLVELLKMCEVMK